MKRFCLTAAMAFAFAANSPGEALLSEHFNYTDGPVTQDSNSPWMNHGGTANQVDVAQGLLRLTQSETEDVSAPLPGSPHKSGNLYLSCVVNFVTPPSGNGSFFLHLKDATSTFKARVYATTNSVTPGSYRLGLANGSGTPAFIGADLAFTQSYRIVVRYAAAAPTQSTLWIHPKAETDVDLRVNATDTPAVANITAVALRQSLGSGDGMGTLLMDDLIVGTTFNDVVGENSPPSVSQIPDQDLPGDRSSDPIDFTVDDKETALDNLSIQVESTNPKILPALSVAVKGNGRSRQLILHPIIGQQGATRLTLTVGDGEKVATTSFNVTVGAPSISRIGSGAISSAVNELSSPVVFRISDRETLPDRLTLIAEAVNVQLLPATSFRWEGTGDTRTLRLSPAKDRTGFSVIRVIVTDGTMRATNTFSASVYPQLGMVLSEAFSYPDGPLIVPSRSWSFHAPDAPNPTNLLVRGERLILSGGNAEDAHRLLDCGLQKVDSGTVFYAGFTVKVTQLPSGGGDFFAHFRDDKSGFRGRVHLASGSASTGHFRFGLSSGSEAPVFMSSESALGEDHRLVLRYEVSTAACSLWLDPADEASPSIRATVEGSTISASNWAFRQAAGIGGMEVDDLAISSRFSDVAHVAAAPRLLVERAADSLVLRWPILPGFALQQVQQIEAVSAAWTDVLTSPTNDSGMARVALPITGSANFFRLLQK